MPSRRSCTLTLPLLLGAILAKMSGLSTMKAFARLPLPFLTVFSYVPYIPTVVAFSWVLCLGLVALVVLVVFVVLIALISSPLGVYLLGLGLISLHFLLAILIVSLK